MCGVDEDLEREREREGETQNALSSKSSPLWLATWVEIGLKLCGSFLGFICWRATAAASRPSILRVKMNQQFLLCVAYYSTNSKQLSENVKLGSVEKHRQAGKNNNK